MQPPDWFKKYLWQVLAVFLYVASVAAGTWLTVQLGVQPPPEPIPVPVPVAVPEVQAPVESAPPNAFGWVEDKVEVRAIQAAMPFPVFADTPAGKQVDPLPASAYLWDAYARLFDGRRPPPQDQNPVGSCVSFGGSRAYERSLACQIVSGDRFEFRHLSEEAVYALSRVEIGGGRIRGDGSVGAWAAQAFTKYGGLPKGIYGQHDLTAYNPSRCRQWGATGLPDDLEPETRKYPAGDCAMVRSWDEAKRALANGYGIFVCSNQGFARQRDANGVCRAQGMWMHCMALDGFHTQGGREYGHIENSWGPNYHIGPVGWGNPSTAGFWCESAVLDRMLRQGDSWAVSSVRGFPVKRLDWFAIRQEVSDEDAPDRLGLARRPDLRLAW